MQTHKDNIEKIDLFDCRKRQLVLLPERQTVCIRLAIKKYIYIQIVNSIYNFCLASGGGVVGAEGSVGGGEAGGEQGFHCASAKSTLQDQGWGKGQPGLGGGG